MALLCTVPLAWRRRAPLAAFALIMATFSLSLAFTGAMGSFLAGLFPALIGAYSVARYETRRRVFTGIGLAFAGMLLLAATVDQFRQAEELVFEAIMWCSAWLLGSTVRRGENRARQLGRRAERLERDSEAQTRAAVMDERARIARELHDVVAHGVSVMVVQAGAARSILSADERDAARRTFRSSCGSRESRNRSLRASV